MTNYSWTGATDDWGVAADWSPTGVPGSTDAATIAAPGTYTVTVSTAEAAASLLLNDAAATLEIDATLAVGGLFTAAAGTVALTGTLQDTVVAGTGAAFDYNFATFDHVTYEGTLDLGDNGVLFVQDGLRVTGAGGTGAGEIDVTGSGDASLIVSDSETIDNVTINVGSDTGFDSFNANGATLTLGAGVVLNSVGVNGLQLGGIAVVTNDGTINLGVSGGAAAISTDFVNAGQLNVTNGQSLAISGASFGNTGAVFIDSASTVTFEGTAIAATQASGGSVDIEGVLNDNGSTIDLGAGSAFADTTLGGTLENAVIVSDGGVASYNFGTLQASTVDGTLDLGASGVLFVTGGLTVAGAGGTGAGVIDVTGAGAASLIVSDSETLDHVTINVGSNAGFDSLNANGGTFTLGAAGVLNSVGLNGLQLQGIAAVSNLGKIAAGVAGAAAFIDTASFSNAGIIAVSNRQTLTLTSESGTVVSTGSILVSGGGSLDLTSALSGAGHVAVGAGSTLQLGGAVSSGQAIALQGTGVNLILGEPAMVAASISGFVSGDRIDLAGLSPDVYAVSRVGNNAVVTGGAAPFTLTMGPIAAGQGFGLVVDGLGGSDLIVGRVITGPTHGGAHIGVPTGNALITAHGSNNSITVGSGDTVINAGGGLARVSVGNGNAVVTIAGNLDAVMAGNGNDIVHGTANASAVKLGDGNDEVRLTGSLDFVHTGDGHSTIAVNGAADLVGVGAGSNAIALQGNHDVALLGSGINAVTVSGGGDAVFLGVGSPTVTDAGHGLVAVAGLGAGNSMISGVGSDPAFALDLIGGVGGYTSGAAAYAALTTDGHGGSLLALGSTGSVDFLGVAATQLSAGNFHVLHCAASA